MRCGSVEGPATCNFPPLQVLMDHLHSAAFEGSGLGLSILGPVENIQTKITKSTIDDFVKTHYTGVFRQIAFSKFCELNYFSIAIESFNWCCCRPPHGSGRKWRG